MENAGNGLWIVPKHETEIVGIFGDSWAVCDSPETVVGCCMEFMH